MYKKERKKKFRVSKSWMFSLESWRLQLKLESFMKTVRPEKTAIFILKNLNSFNRHIFQFLLIRNLILDPDYPKAGSEFVPYSVNSYGY
jgi:hypothetical protein